MSGEGRYIMLVSVHGLIRGHDLELGRDADTGGQTTYVVELARALARHDEIARVDLVTRLVEDSKVDANYAQPFEKLAPGAQIVRIRCGPRRYLAKERLWPHLDSFVDNLLQYVRSLKWGPDLIHGHYADAGYVAACVSGVLNTPMAFTGHSLGRVKRQRLLDGGQRLESIERRYNIAERIAAEEVAIDHASFVVASTHQEVDQQYAQYDNYQPERMRVIPPGVDLSRFTPASRRKRWHAPVHQRVRAFLADWNKPMILALCRPDPRKNIAALVRAFGEHPDLREIANLCIVAGNRDDIRELEKGAREVLTELLMLVDRYDLYGCAAYPKHHDADDVPDLYRMAARTRGVFVNPALTEPFGLTLIEAAATGLPIIATQDGGPRDIIRHCENGVLIDPLDVPALGAAMHAAVTDPQRWRSWSRNGIRGAQKYYSWPGHVERYVRAARAAEAEFSRGRMHFSRKSRLVTADRVLVADIDDTLTGDAGALRRLVERLKQAGDRVAFGIATGRSMEMTLQVLAEWRVPTPQLLITSVGSAIHYGRKLAHDRSWEKHIDYQWQPEAIREAMTDLPGITLQGPEGQDTFKISFLVDTEEAIGARQIHRYLRRAGIRANVIFSRDTFLDILPIRASKGMALRYFCTKWNVPLERCLVAGDSGNDIEMLTGNTLAVVVGNHAPELESLRGAPRIYFAKAHHAAGILEGMEHYDFLGKIRIPEQEPAHELAAV